MDFLRLRWIAVTLAIAVWFAIAQAAPVNAAPAVLHPLVADEWATENYRLNLLHALMWATGDDRIAIATAESIATLESKLHAGLPANMVSALREGYNFIAHDYRFTLLVSSDFSQPVSVCMEKENRIITARIFPDGSVVVVEPLAQPRHDADAANPDQAPYACLPHSAIAATRMIEALSEVQAVRH